MKWKDLLEFLKEIERDEPATLEDPIICFDDKNNHAEWIDDVDFRTSREVSEWCLIINQRMYDGN